MIIVNNIDFEMYGRDVAAIERKVPAHMETVLGVGNYNPDEWHIEIEVTADLGIDDTVVICKGRIAARRVR